MAEQDPAELDVKHPAWRDGPFKFGGRVPEGVERCELEPPCPSCKSRDGYDDRRYGTTFCARCGRNIARRDP